MEFLKYQLNFLCHRIPSKSRRSIIYKIKKALYIKVDHDYPLFMAKIAKKNSILFMLLLDIPHYSLLTG